MYVEMAHYTDDDTLVLICVTNINNFEVQEYKLEKLKDKNWSFIVQRFCSGNSSDQILSNVETLFASLEFQMLVRRIYMLIVTKDFDAIASMTNRDEKEMANEEIRDTEGERYT